MSSYLKLCQFLISYFYIVSFFIVVFALLLCFYFIGPKAHLCYVLENPSYQGPHNSLQTQVTPVAVFTPPPPCSRPLPFAPAWGPCTHHMLCERHTLPLPTWTHNQAQWNLAFSLPRMKLLSYTALQDHILVCRCFIFIMWPAQHRLQYPTKLTSTVLL